MHDVEKGLEVFGGGVDLDRVVRDAVRLEEVSEVGAGRQWESRQEGSSRVSGEMTEVYEVLRRDRAMTVEWWTRGLSIGIGKR